MMKNNERMTRWLLDAIDTEIAKPDGELTWHWWKNALPCWMN